MRQPLNLKLCFNETIAIQSGWAFYGRQLNLGTVVHQSNFFAIFWLSSHLCALVLELWIFSPDLLTVDDNQSNVDSMGARCNLPWKVRWRGYGQLFPCSRRFGLQIDHRRCSAHEVGIKSFVVKWHPHFIAMSWEKENHQGKSKLREIMPVYRKQCGIKLRTTTPLLAWTSDLSEGIP